MAGPAWTLLHGGELQLELQLWRPSCRRWVMSTTTHVFPISGLHVGLADQGTRVGLSPVLCGVSPVPSGLVSMSVTASSSMTTMATGSAAYQPYRSKMARP
jgi:hypothetical protein